MTRRNETAVHGIYNLDEVAQLIGVPVDELQRWFDPESDHFLWRLAWEWSSGEPALDFSDLVQARIVADMLRSGASMREIADELASSGRDEGARPFATKAYGERLRRGEFEYDSDGTVIRWWPLGRDGRVVVDPRRRCGSPILDDSGVPAWMLIEHTTEITGDPVQTAEDFEVDVADVEAALRFQKAMEEDRSRTHTTSTE